MTRLILQMMIAAALLAPASAAPATAQPMDAAGIVGKMQQAFFYPGDSFRARIKMTLKDISGGERFRELTMLRVNMPGGDQKYFMYFHAPGDVRRMAFLVYKYAAKASDRWLFIPALNLVQRIAAKDSQSSFVGSDFSYEDVSGRNIEADIHKLLREEELGGRPCYVVESMPKAAAAYKRKVSWIDKTTFLPLREEYYDVQNQLFREFSAEEIKEIDGVPTAMKRSMKNVKSGHQTVVEFSATKYRLALKSEDFSERALRNPPGSWIK